MAWDPNVSLGSIITIVSMAASALISYTKTKSKVESLDKKYEEHKEFLNERWNALREEFRDLKSEVTKLRESDTQQAVLAQRVVALETEAKVSSLAALVQRVNSLEKELNRMVELEGFRRQNEPVRR